MPIITVTDMDGRDNIPQAPENSCSANDGEILATRAEDTRNADKISSIPSILPANPTEATMESSPLNTNVINAAAPVSAIYDVESQRAITTTTSTQRKKLPVVDVLVNFAAIFIAAMGTEFVLKMIGPYRRGFFCDDTSIRLPYKKETVPATLLCLYCLIVSAVLFGFGEFLRLTNGETAKEQLSEYEGGEPLKMRLLVRWVYFYGHFAIAFSATFIFTTIAKYPVGRLRPHFIDLCRPNVTEFCVREENWHTYVQNYVCESGAEAKKLVEARLSFFSGHSSMAMCASVFMAIYLQARLSPLFRPRCPVLTPLLQILVLSTGMLIAYSRIQDHMHHSQDVLIGMIAGSWMAAFGVQLAFGLAGLKIWPTSSTEYREARQVGNGKRSTTESTTVIAETSSSNVNRQI